MSIQAESEKKNPEKGTEYGEFWSAFGRWMGPGKVGGEL